MRLRIDIRTTQLPERLGCVIIKHAEPHLDLEKPSRGADHAAPRYSAVPDGAYQMLVEEASAAGDDHHLRQRGGKHTNTWTTVYLLQVHASF